MDSLTLDPGRDRDARSRLVARLVDARLRAARDAGPVLSRVLAPRAARLGQPATVARARSDAPFVFGGAIALTVYGAYEMYQGRRRRRTITALEWVMVVLFVVTFSWIALRLHRAASSASSGSSPMRRKRAAAPPRFRRRPRSSCRSTTRRRRGSLARCRRSSRTSRAPASAGASTTFFLSDTTDANVWIAEERAFLAMRERLPQAPASTTAAGARTRAARPATSPTSSPAGAARYEHMLVLDADSLMSGEAIVALAAAMEADPDAGIIQSLPLIINRNTMFARVQQFAARIAGPVIAAGPQRLDGPRRQLLGPQRDHPHARLRRPLRPAGPARQAAVRRPHPQPRFRRGGADAARRLCGLHAADARRLATRRARPR